jgi:sulfonate transport system ATP-binding protein
MTSVPARTARGEAVRVSGLTKRYGSTVVLDDLDLSIAAGEFVALLGASGCGKSTLLRVVAGLDPNVDGDCIVATRRAVSFQSPRLLPWKRVWRNVVLGVPGATRSDADRALAEVNLSHRSRAWPVTLSGGEAQRAALARALVRAPDLLLLDEPFAALDALTRITAQDLVADLWQRHAPAVLLVTHDVDEALRLADRVLVMSGGRIAHDTPVELRRPRHVDDAGYLSLRRELLARLGVTT